MKKLNKILMYEAIIIVILVILILLVTKLSNTKKPYVYRLEYDKYEHTVPDIATNDIQDDNISAQ